MKLPEMKYSDRIRKSKQLKFGGLNRSLGAEDGELQDMRNMTADQYPLLASRERRYCYHKLSDPGGLFSWEGLCWADGTGFYYRGEKKGNVQPGDKRFASLGRWIIIMPDKCCYNVDTGEFKSMEAQWEGEKLTFCDGKLYGEDAEANAVTCQGVDWGSYFSVGDGVTISGCTAKAENNKTLVIRAIDADKLYFYENSFALEQDGAAYTENGQMRIARTVPDLLYMCENENRLWGCTESTIYACKQGDVFNWNVNEGLESDAYTVSTVSAGGFTGCISYRGFPTFFKEDHVYKVYGSVPSNFEVLGSATLGLSKDSPGSLAIAGETLFYLSRSGVMAYTGGIPQPIGTAFGTEKFQNAIGGSDGLKYYISMESSQGQRGLYVYDTQKGLWHREDELYVTHFAKDSGGMYMLDKDGNIWLAGNCHSIPKGSVAEEDVQWMAEFADFTDEEPNKKGVTKIQIRLELDAGADAQVWLQFDSDGQWQKVGSMLCEDVKRSYYLPIIPRRADHYRLRITGTGGCRVYSIAREYYTGSPHRSK